MDNYLVVAEGLDSLDDFASLQASILTSARQAINRTAERFRTASAKAMRNEVNFPAQYLNERLTVSRKARGVTLEAAITGRHRPTSLARFATTRKAPGKQGISVKVNPGHTKVMKRAFLMRLPQGSTMTDTQFNMGLAIRLKDGEKLENKKHMKKIGRGLYLLYGPSVDQVFRTVSEDMAPKAAEFLEAEFTRLMSL